MRIPDAVHLYAHSTHLPRTFSVPQWRWAHGCTGAGGSIQVEKWFRPSPSSCSRRPLWERRTEAQKNLGGIRPKKAVGGIGGADPWGRECRERSWSMNLGDINQSDSWRFTVDGFKWRNWINQMLLPSSVYWLPITCRRPMTAEALLWLLPFLRD